MISPNSAGLLLLSILATLSACSRYSVSINKNVVYEPPHLFNDYTIGDTALRRCVRSTIAENGLTQPEQLLRLICPPGKIEDLTGLQVFGNIEYLGLGGNKLAGIAPIGTMTGLKQLDLSENDVADFSPLRDLANLEFLDASGNRRAICSSLPNAKNSAKFEWPEHCSPRVREGPGKR